MFEIREPREEAASLGLDWAQAYDNSRRREVGFGMRFPNLVLKARVSNRMEFGFEFGPLDSGMVWLRPQLNMFVISFAVVRFGSKCGVEDSILEQEGVWVEFGLLESGIVWIRTARCTYIPLRW